MHVSPAQKVLVIGRTGQVAQALAHAGAGRVVNVGRPELDLRRPASLTGAIDRHAPDVVINAAGFTKVDQAEAEPVEAESLNVDGPRALAIACRSAGIPFIHMSTDCVFDGTLARPYRPDDLTRPLSVYGDSKLRGELAVADALDRHLIVRVSWVFSQYAANFVRTMLALARTREQVTVVSDQIGFPTHAPALASGLLAMADAICSEHFSQWGIYHLAGNGETDRASLARAVFDLSRRHGGSFAQVEGVLTADYPTPASRPLNARLDMSFTQDVFGIKLPRWEDGLAETVPLLVRELAAN
ncbi:MAG: dTDP-4-dehydrorhamnose reductase [Alphaproteobacteria bacterium]|nr:dTDP-4-dehydrorhamnose reductase [Alphaproteobacteria bacterium]MBU2082414.1 dTDP-4-dehydrorhamnose reductase [Alphaproteobacteria bacterium]MBU2142874.1 dTDP-4-dehydrorhamnose reductase [Alphaproteobacteria bacterium]MBU2196170.1 dTDP-4-dehydrorhamnose reductase [Alphaproteobacteria bacterium]